MIPKRQHQTMRTTLTLDDELAADLCAETRRTGETFKEIVNECLRLSLERRRGARTANPFSPQVEKRSLRAGMDYVSGRDLFEKLDGPSHK